MPAKKYYVGIERTDFNCARCGRLVSVDEQRELKYHQTTYCRECQKIYRRKYVREAVKKHLEEKKQTPSKN